MLRPFFPRSHGKPRVDDRGLRGIVFVDRNGLRWRDARKGYVPNGFAHQFAQNLLADRPHLYRSMSASTIGGTLDFAKMNEWQKVGSGKGGQNVRNWVAGRASRMADCVVAAVAASDHLTPFEEGAASVGFGQKPPTSA